jgi:hypothetical protein
MRSAALLLRPLLLSLVKRLWSLGLGHLDFTFLLLRSY